MVSPYWLAACWSSRVASPGRGDGTAGGTLAGRFGRPRRRLRAGLLQLLCAVAGLGLGLLLPRITAEATVASTRVTEALVAVGFGVLGLVSLIFSLLFLVVQWAFTSLSPRLNLFRDDPIVWRTFGLGHRRVRVLGHHGPGHRQPAESVGDRAGRRGGGGARRPRPDPDACR